MTTVRHCGQTRFFFLGLASAGTRLPCCTATASDALALAAARDVPAIGIGNVRSLGGIEDPCAALPLPTERAEGGGVPPSLNVSSVL